MNAMLENSPANSISPKEKENYTVSPHGKLWFNLGAPKERMTIAINPISGGDFNNVKMLIWSDDQMNEVISCWEQQSKYPSTKGMIRWLGEKFNVYTGGNVQSQLPWKGLLQNDNDAPFVFSIDVNRL